MIPYSIIEGDATKPEGPNWKIICHVCNDINKWGKGFVMALSKRWPQPEREYHEWFEHPDRYKQEPKLGEIQFVHIPETHIDVVNMIAQEGIYPKNDIPPIRYEALEMCLVQICEAIELFPDRKYSVHMPYLIGCGLAGGRPKIVLGIIRRTLCENDIPVYIYDYKEKK